MHLAARDAADAAIATHGSPIVRIDKPGERFPACPARETDPLAEGPVSGEPVSFPTNLQGIVTLAAGRASGIAGCDNLPLHRVISIDWTTGTFTVSGWSGKLSHRAGHRHDRAFLSDGGGFAARARANDGERLRDRDSGIYNVHLMAGVGQRGLRRTSQCRVRLVGALDRHRVRRGDVGVASPVRPPSTPPGLAR